MDKTAGLLGKALDVLKVSTTAALGGAFATGLLLFTPDGLIASLGMDAVMAAWRPWVGLAFLAFAAVLAARAAASVGAWAKKRWTWWTNERNLRKRLHRLAPDEKEILARFLLERRKCLRFPMADGVSQGLAAAKILFRSSNVGNVLDGFDFSMQPWAWAYLNKNPHLVVSDPEKMALLMERTAIADVVGFTDGEAPWTERPARRRRWPC